mmetsp:Transcript_5688/g.13302  ORF Transcript_5688/g.13302 Transcript_5688/m.13302 type:complete len:443 (-) Transcript_5688:766-2094(-)
MSSRAPGDGARGKGRGGARSPTAGVGGKKGNGTSRGIATPTSDGRQRLQAHRSGSGGMEGEHVSPQQAAIAQAQASRKQPLGSGAQAGQQGRVPLVRQWFHDYQRMAQSVEAANRAMFSVRNFRDSILAAQQSLFTQCELEEKASHGASSAPPPHAAQSSKESQPVSGAKREREDEVITANKRKVPEEVVAISRLNSDDVQSLSRTLSANEKDTLSLLEKCQSDARGYFSRDFILIGDGGKAISGLSFAETAKYDTLYRESASFKDVHARRVHEQQRYFLKKMNARFPGFEARQNERAWSSKQTSSWMEEARMNSQSQEGQLSAWRNNARLFSTTMGVQGLKEAILNKFKDGPVSEIAVEVESATVWSLAICFLCMLCFHFVRSSAIPRLSTLSLPPLHSHNRVTASTAFSLLACILGLQLWTQRWNGGIRRMMINSTAPFL